jgi:CBS domain-containing protein
MAQKIRDVMTSNPCTIDAEKSVAYAAKMMREEDVGLAPIVEGDKLIGMLTDRDIATRVAAQGKNPDRVKVRDVASKQLVTIDPGQDLDEALRMMAKHQVRRLPVVEEDGRLVGVVAQADIAREGDDAKTGRLVEGISEPGGQMSSFEEGQFSTQFPPRVEGQQEGQEVVQPEERREGEAVSKVQAASSRGRRRKRATTARKTTARKTTARKRTTATRKKRATTGRKKKTTTARKRSAATRARTTTRKRKTTARKKTTGARKRKTTARKKTTGARKRKTTARKKTTTARKRSTTGRKRKTTARKKTTGTRKRKTTARKKTTTARKRSTGRKTVRAAGRKGGRATARKRRTSRK